MVEQHTETNSLIKWEAADGENTLIPEFAVVFRKVSAAFYKYFKNNIPKILSITSSKYEIKSSWVIEIQLPGGVIVDIDSHVEDSYNAGPIDLASASDDAADLVLGIAENCETRGFEKLTDEINDAKLALTTLFRQWSNNTDSHIHIVDLRIKTSEFLRDTLQTPIFLTISCLNDYLIPDEMNIEVWHPHNAVAEVIKFHAEIKTRLQAKARLKTQGADGFIDLIAMNSLLLGDHAMARPENYLGILQEPNLHADYKIKSGRLYLEATDMRYDRINWHDGYINLYDLHIPSTMCDNLPGKPITDLIEHPFLTSEVIIKGIERFYGGKYYKIAFEQPYFCYCRKTGYFWAEREFDGSHKLYR